MTTPPTLTDIFNNISSDLKTRFSISSENDLKRTLTALASSDAGMIKLFYLAIADVIKNSWPDTADSEANGGRLENFGRVKLGRDPYPAKQGEYVISYVNSGTVNMPVDTQIKAGSETVIPNTTFAVVSSTINTANILCANTGTDYKLSVGDVLYTVSPIPYIESKVTVTAIIVTPVDAENIEDYRALVLQSFALEYTGGSTADYCKWAMDVEGIRKIYPLTTLGNSGSVSIFAEAIENVSTDGNGTPTQLMMDSLWKNDYTGVIERDPTDNTGRRQLGLTDIYILPVTPKPVIVTITNLKNQVDSVKTSIFAQIKTILYNKRPFIIGVDNINNQNDRLYQSDISAAVQNAVEIGNTFDNITVTIDGSSTPYTFASGNIPYLSAVNYV